MNEENVIYPKDIVLDARLRSIYDTIKSQDWNGDVYGIRDQIRQINDLQRWRGEPQIPEEDIEIIKAFALLRGLPRLISSANQYALEGKVSETLNNSIQASRLLNDESIEVGDEWEEKIRKEAYKQGVARHLKLAGLAARADDYDQAAYERREAKDCAYHTRDRFTKARVRLQTIPLTELLMKGLKMLNLGELTPEERAYFEKEKTERKYFGF